MINRAKHDIQTYNSAVDLYMIDHNDQLPNSLNQLQGGERDYVKKVANDPWGNPYVYEKQDKKYRIFSRGPDGQASTADDVALYD